MENRKNKALKIVIIIIGVVLILFCLGFSRNGKNPHHFVLFGKDYIDTVESIERVDEVGNLYKIEYTANYHNPLIRILPNYLHLSADKGCSSFYKSDEVGINHTYHNYDFVHFDDENNLTSIITLVKCKPENGYASFAFADAYLFNVIGLKAYEGTLDNKKLDVSATLFLPWICVDGMNEKGLAVSALYVDVKEGESPTYQTKEGQPQATATELLRYILDGCADVDEAIQLAQEYNMINTSGNDYHLFVSDKNKSVILEWRYNELYVVECDIATNFFLAFDDAEDIYYGDLLKEAWTGPADTEKEYQYGYGHGFARFKEIASFLDKQEYLNPEEGLDLLSRVAQTYKDDGVSQETHYSLVYNHQNSTVDVYLRKNYEKVYSFNFDAK